LVAQRHRTRGADGEGDGAASEGGLIDRLAGEDGRGKAAGLRQQQAADGEKKYLGTFHGRFAGNDPSACSYFVDWFTIHNSLLSEKTS